MALSDEVKWFKENQERLRGAYPNQYLVVYRELVRGAFDTPEEAFDLAKKIDPGNVLIRHVDDPGVGFVPGGFPPDERTPPNKWEANDA